MVLILIAGLSVNSQQVKYGVFLGPQATTVHYKINDTTQDNSYKFGFQAGFNMKIPLEGRLYFAPSIGYNLRGYKVKLKNSSPLPDIHAIDNNTTFHTIELSALLQHDFKLEYGHMFFRIGPSLDFALMGKEEFSVGNGQKVKRDMVFSFGDYGHYLASANLHFGYETTKFFIYAQYNYSLTTMGNNDFGPEKIANRAIGISFGTYFN